MKIKVVSDHVLSSLGTSTERHIVQLKNGNSGIQSHAHLNAAYASVIGDDTLESEFAELWRNNIKYTKLEKMFIISIHQALRNTDIDVSDPKTVFVFATTKGNIDLLANTAEEKNENRISITDMVKTILSYFGHPHKPVIICNACVSGLQAIITARMLLSSGQYHHAIVAGGDTVSQFTLTGFQSLQAVSPFPCRPFDISRQGISPGEACSTIILSTVLDGYALVERGATSNDANHISGPSRTGEGLHQAIEQTMKYNPHILRSDLHYISAHGTGTIYNDEMESMAIHRSDLMQVPVNSLKGYFGHTMGAAGILESVIGISCMLKNLLLPTLGLSDIGVSNPVRLIIKAQNTPIQHFIKLASGFGGCNAALLFSKI